MQSICRSSLPLLSVFINNPTWTNAENLFVLPVLYHILEKDHVQGQGYSEDVLGLCLWMKTHAKEVLNKVLGGASCLALPEAATEELLKKDWCKVSCTMHSHADM